MPSIVPLKGPIWIVGDDGWKGLARYCYTCHEYVGLNHWNNHSVATVQKRCDGCIKFAVENNWG
jgi:hypothetical protein